MARVALMLAADVPKAAADLHASGSLSRDDAGGTSIIHRIAT
jgi:hypothetical protein